MSLIDYSIDKIKIFHTQYQMKLDYDLVRNNKESEFIYLKKICLLFKDKKGFLTERERLGILAEIYSKDTLTVRQKKYLFNNFFKQPESNEPIFFRLTEREKEVEMAKEIWANITI